MRKTAHSGQALLEYLLIASVILAAILSLKGLIEHKVGVVGEAGSLMDVVRDQLVADPDRLSAGDMDGLLGL
jgi:hypothetical protein